MNTRDLERLHLIGDAHLNLTVQIGKALILFSGNPLLDFGNRHAEKLPERRKLLRGGFLSFRGHHPDRTGRHRGRENNTVPVQDPAADRWHSGRAGKADFTLVLQEFRSDAALQIEGTAHENAEESGDAAKRYIRALRLNFHRKKRIFIRSKLQLLLLCFPVLLPKRFCTGEHLKLHAFYSFFRIFIHCSFPFGAAADGTGLYSRTTVFRLVAGPSPAFIA